MFTEGSLIMSKLGKLNLPAAGGIGLCLAVLLTVILCVPGAAAINSGFLPLSAAQAWAVAAAGLAVFVAVFILTRIRRRQALPLAGFVACGYILTASAISAAAGGGVPVGVWIWRLCLCVLCGGCAGALLSIGQKPRKRHRA